MSAILANSFQEKIRGKSLYIISGISIIIILFLVLASELSVNNQAITSFNELLNVSIIMANFLSSLLAIMLSLQTIPNEFERKTTHLVLVRGIKKHEYLLSLTFSNVLISLLGLVLIYIGPIIFTLLNGRLDIFSRLILSMLILGINIILISTITSFFSVIFPLFLNGILGVVILIIGSLHNILYLLSQNMGGVFAKIVKAILFIWPNLYQIQRQAGNILFSKNIEIRPILVQLLFIYIYITMIIIFSSRKEV